jgi:hypothetical protein
MISTLKLIARCNKHNVGLKTHSPEGIAIRTIEIQSGKYHLDFFAFYCPAVDITDESCYFDGHLTFTLEN